MEQFLSCLSALRDLVKSGGHYDYATERHHAVEQAEMDSLGVTRFADWPFPALSAMHL